MQTLDSISVPAKDEDMKKNIEDEVKSITIPMMAKMFLFGSYVKNQALKRIKADDPSESIHHQSLGLTFTGWSKLCNYVSGQTRVCLKVKKDSTPRPWRG